MEQPAPHHSEGEDGPLIIFAAFWSSRHGDQNLKYSFKGFLLFLGGFVLVPWSWRFFVFEDAQPPAAQAASAIAESEDWLVDGV